MLLHVNNAHTWAIERAHKQQQCSNAHASLSGVSYAKVMSLLCASYASVNAVMRSPHDTQLIRSIRVLQGRSKQENISSGKSR